MLAGSPAHGRSRGSDEHGRLSPGCRRPRSDRSGRGTPALHLRRSPISCRHPRRPFGGAAPATGVTGGSARHELPLLGRRLPRRHETGARRGPVLDEPRRAGPAAQRPGSGLHRGPRRPAQPGQGVRGVRLAAGSHRRGADPRCRPLLARERTGRPRHGRGTDVHLRHDGSPEGGAGDPPEHPGEHRLDRLVPGAGADGPRACRPSLLLLLRRLLAAHAPSSGCTSGAVQLLRLSGGRRRPAGARGMHGPRRRPVVVPAPATGDDLRPGATCRTCGSSSRRAAGWLHPSSRNSPMPSLARGCS